MIKFKRGNRGQQQRKETNMRALKLKEDRIASGVITITPKLANQYLEKNTKNRPISRHMVKKYAEIMKAGRWVLNGEAIIVSNNGTLIDGQHRLEAVAQAGVSVPMLVVEGVDNGSFVTVDVGKKRTGADALSTYSDKYDKNRAIIAAAAKLVWTFDKDGVFEGRTNRGRLENDELIEFVEKHRGLLRSVEFALTLHTARKIVPASALAALHYLLSKKDVPLAEKLFSKLNSGENIAKNDPIGSLRNRLFILSQETGVIRAREVIPYIVKTWELLRKGENIERLYVPKDYLAKII